MRVLGNAIVADYGLRPPRADEVTAARSMAVTAPHAFPRGVYRLPSHEVANAQAEAWDAQAVARRQRDIATGVVGWGAGRPLGRLSRLTARVASAVGMGKAGTMGGPGLMADWDCVAKLAGTLDRYGVDYALVGGYALGLNGVPGRLDDVDMLVSDDFRDSVPWTDALCGLFPPLSAELRDWNASPFGPARSNGEGRVRVVGDFVVDIVPRIGELTLDGLRAHVATVAWRGVPVRTLDLAGLRLAKGSGRLRDDVDLLAIDAALEALGGDPRGTARVDARGRVTRGPARAAAA